MSMRFIKHSRRSLRSTTYSVLRILTAMVIAAFLAACAAKPAAPDLPESTGEKPVSKFEELKQGSAEPVEIETGDHKPVVAPLPGAEKQVARYGEAFQSALKLMQEEKWQEAIDELNTFEPRVSKISGPSTNLGLAYLKLEKYADAEKAFKRAIGINPSNPYAQNLLGIALRKQGKFDEAKGAYEAAIALDARYAAAHYNLGVMADLYIGDLDLAWHHYSQYQSLLKQPDEVVGRWLVDLENRGAKPRVLQTMPVTTTATTAPSTAEVTPAATTNSDGATTP